MHLMEEGKWQLLLVLHDAVIVTSKHLSAFQSLQRAVAYYNRRGFYTDVFLPVSGTYDTSLHHLCVASCQF